MANKQAGDMVKIRGVGLKMSEWEEIEKIGDSLGIKPHAVLQYAVRYFLKAWHEGKIKIKTETRKAFPDL